MYNVAESMQISYFQFDEEYGNAGRCKLRVATDGFRSMNYDDMSGVAGTSFGLESECPLRSPDTYNGSAPWNPLLLTKVSPSENLYRKNQDRPSWVVGSFPANVGKTEWGIKSSNREVVAAAAVMAAKHMKCDFLGMDPNCGALEWDKILTI